MTRYHKALSILFVTVFGLWGCARAPEASGSGNGGGDKIKALESKTAKLEEDLKAALAVKEQMRKKLADADEAQSLLHQEIAQLQLAAKERDELKGDLKARTQERDQLQTQYDGFRKNIKELLGQAEATTRNGNSNVGPENRELAGPALRGGGN